VKKRVVVVGGGPGGLEAARMAALRGHEVRLFEKAAQLGGQVTISALAPNRQSMAGIIRWLELQVRKQGVSVCLETEATAEQVLALSPEAVVIATGGKPYRPDLPGFDAPEVVTAWEVLTGAVETGENVLILDDDGGETAPSVAEYLTERGKRVEIATTLRRVADRLGDTTFPLVYQRLYGAGVRLTPDVRPLAFEDGTVTLQNLYALTEESREGVDTVVLAMGNRSVDDLYRALKGRISELYLIGDAMAPRGVHNAILEGTYVGRQI
jgi:NADPH-dependent 2,4-dienoyl-CoA reductase/sulfur reductase-like enzyme